MNFKEAVEAYDEARSALQERRAVLKNAEAALAGAKRGLLIAETSLTEARQFEARAARQLLEAAAKVPGLLHADVSGIVGKVEPADPLKPAPGEGVFEAPTLPSP